MDQEHLTGPALMHIHNDISMDAVQTNKQTSKQTKTEHKLARGNMHTGKCGLYIQEHIILVGKHDGTGFTRG